MADTGTELAEGTTRGTTGAIARMLERRFLWNRPHADKPLTGEDDIAIKVRCPREGVDKRAEEVLEALERMDVSADCTIDDRMAAITLRVPRGEAADAQRALERLHASKRSDFTLDDVIGLDRLEEASGRRTLGRAKEEPARSDAVGGEAIPIESSVLTFANHPDDPPLDETEAKAYAEGMRELGFDAAHCPTRQCERTADGLKTTGVRHVVDVSYLDSDREQFVLASTVTLHRIGALAAFGADDPYLDDAASLDRDYEWLFAQAATRLDDFEKNLDVLRASKRTEGTRQDLGGEKRDGHTADERIPDESVGREEGEAQASQETEETQGPAKAEGAGGPSRDDGLTVEEHERMPARERARVDPKHIPDEAFGKQSVREVVREQTAAAAVLNAGKEPVRTHPSIGERVG